MAKRKTNTECFKGFLKSANDTAIAQARAFMVTQAEEILNNKEAIIEQHKNSLITGEFLVAQAEEILAHFKYD